MPHGLDIAPLLPQEIEAAAEVAGRAFLGVPFSRMVIGGDSPRHLTRMVRGMHLMLSRPEGELLGAREDGELVGVMRTVAWPDCQNAAMSATTVPLAWLSIGSAALRIYRYRRAWSRRDPERPHRHLDPLCVRPDRQRRGVGSALLSRFCEQLDRAGDAGYLETEQPYKVRLYERFGFEVVEEATVLGMPNWFMWRDATG